MQGRHAGAEPSHSVRITNLMVGSDGALLPIAPYWTSLSVWVRCRSEDAMTRRGHLLRRMFVVRRGLGLAVLPTDSFGDRYGAGVGDSFGVLVDIVAVSGEAEGGGLLDNKRHAPKYAQAHRCIPIGVALSPTCLPNALRALLWINNAEVLDNLEMTLVGLSDVHVHSNVMLAGHHFSRATWSLSDPCMIQRVDHIFLP
jgi:hypothetical protein